VANEGGGVAGTWKDLTDSVNSMPEPNVRSQYCDVRQLSPVGSFKKITVDVKGEILDERHRNQWWINSMSVGSDARRARSGTEGKVGGQATVKGVRTWKDLPTA